MFSLFLPEKKRLRNPFIFYSVDKKETIVWNELSAIGNPSR